MATTLRIRPHKRPDREPCSLTGCTKGLYALGLCVMHYTRLRTRGEVGPAEAMKAPDGAGHVGKIGYLVLHLPSHPLAGAQGKVGAHRVALFEKLGPADQPCHWCGRELPWLGGAAKAINVDHLDFDKLNNDPGNLVASCLDCNTKRGGNATV